MKNKIFALSFLLCCAISQLKSQSNQVDTINLIKANILDHKSELKGQPFSLLLQKLPAMLPIKFYFPYSLSTKTVKTEFSFVPKGERGWSEVILVVFWQDSTRDKQFEVDHFKESKPMGSWKQSEVDFYKDWIIKDVRLWVIGVGGHEVQ